MKFLIHFDCFLNNFWQRILIPFFCMWSSNFSMAFLDQTAFQSIYFLLAMAKVVNLTGTRMIKKTIGIPLWDTLWYIRFYVCLWRNNLIWLIGVERSYLWVVLQYKLNKKEKQTDHGHSSFLFKWECFVNSNFLFHSSLAIMACSYSNFSLEWVLPLLKCFLSAVLTNNNNHSNYPAKQV